MTEPPRGKPISFGARLKELMAQSGMNQTELAKRTGIERSEVNRTVNDKRPPKSFELELYAGAFKITVAKLLEGAEVPAPVRKAVDAGREAAEQLLRAQSERDAARAQLAEVRRQLTEERTRCSRERSALMSENEALRAQVDELNAKHANDLRKARAQHVIQVAELNGEIESLRDESEQMDAAAGFWKLRTEQLEEKQASEQGKAVLSAVVAGFAGAWLASSGRS